MEQLIKKSNWLTSQTSTEFLRYLHNQIDWSWRCIGIVGARGVGKTTLLLQHLKQNQGISSEAIYVTMDDLYFTNNSLYDFVEQMRAYGTKYFFIDEVHKYKTWARELKNTYDTYADIFVIFTGSSIVDILKENVDLSRRAVIYKLHGLSFREYLAINNTLQTEAISLDSILKSHVEISHEVVSKIRPLEYFNAYLKNGYYPFFIENANVYHLRVEQMLNLIIESDLSFIDGFNPKYGQKIKQLLYIISLNVPLTPNISQLSQKIGINRGTLVDYLHYLEKAEIVKLLFSSRKSISTLQKPDKIYLNNTNIAHVLSTDNVNVGTIRETFFINQLSVKHQLRLPKQGDFLIDDTYTIEVGGKNKDFKQIANIPNSYIAMADSETGVLNKIPLWLWGFLY